jgi:hypothetical protein
MIMDGNQLSELISQRWAILRELLDVGDRQMAAIRDGRMSELMRLLSGKQLPLQRLSEIADELRGATDDDPQARVWESEEARLFCRGQQEECEKMHLALLAIEAECETTLQQSRSSIQQKLDRVDVGRQAATSYGQGQTRNTSGGTLDLSSD